MAKSITLQSGLGQVRNISNSPRWIVVGVTGVTGSGKTTLTQSLLSTLPTTTIYMSQDEYILPNEYPGHLKAPQEIGGINKESLDSINMTKMLADIKEILASDPAIISLRDHSMIMERGKVIGSALPSPRPPPMGRRENSNGPAVLLLEGFLLLNHPEIPPLCQLLYCLTLTQDQCLDRRSKRGYTSGALNSQQYFELCTWPSHQQHFTQMCDTVRGINFLAGADTPNSLSDRVLKDVLQFIGFTEVFVAKLPKD